MEEGDGERPRTIISGAPRNKMRNERFSKRHLLLTMYLASIFGRRGTRRQNEKSYVDDPTLVVER